MNSGQKWCSVHLNPPSDQCWRRVDQRDQMGDCDVERCINQSKSIVGLNNKSTDKWNIGVYYALPNSNCGACKDVQNLSLGRK